MPWDDDDPGAPPPPPEDRPWRHPSELGPGGTRQQVVLVSRPVAGRLWLVGVLACLLGSATTVAVLGLAGAFDDSGGPTAVERVSTFAPGDTDKPTIDMAAPVLPAIVRIEARSPAGVVNGTGVIIRSDGYLLATSDCVDGAESLTVWLDDGSTLPATLVGRDRDSDIALLRVERTDLPAASLLDPPPNATTNEALAFGDPMVVIDAAPASGPTPALSDGFVSDTSRRVVGDDGHTMFGMVQVSTSPRTTGAGTGRVLIDPNGTVVGIVSGRNQAGEGSPTDASGLALQFATPADHAYGVVGQLLEGGRVANPMLGVTGEDVSGTEAERLGADAGLRLETVEGASPTEAAGLRPGDLVVAIDGQPVTDLNDLVVVLRQHRPGDAVGVTYVRSGEKDITHAVLTEKAALP